MAKQRRRSDPGKVMLEDGEAYHAGDGLFVVFQKDECTNERYSTVLSVEDMQQMIASLRSTEPMAA